jgi:S-adenosylmethionine:tRNA ribosyltransferase-isomerase
VHTDDFDFFLPPELIAQHPLATRDASRLLHVNSVGHVHHRQFTDLTSLVGQGDLVVFNDSKVIPARLLGKKKQSDGKAELLLVRPIGTLSTPDSLKTQGALWTCLGQSSKGFKVNMELEFNGGLTAVVREMKGNGEYVVELISPQHSLEAALDIAGQLPLPPYMQRAPQVSDAERYQTVFARDQGSVAAPTAGLHFTHESLEALKAKGAEISFVTLEVGPGTFMPVREGDVSLHHMHAERAHLSPETAEKISQASRVIAVGTTVVRTLESMSDASGRCTPGTIDTSIFITPGYQFKVIDSLVTNFHLPKSTLLMLVSAFLGREKTLAVYREAIAQQYRFFSYGDAMFLEGHR